ncbi:MAG TPA: hypothetical protein VHG90_00755 [Acidimicrobiales bacterium]|nr:hypothetical protein [Acidimicrobiales bacterium]
MIDQGLSSVTNFVVTLVVARQADPHEFGTFGVGLTVYLLVLWLSRSLTTEPFVVRLTAAGPDDQRSAAREAVGAATALGLATAAVLLAAAALGGPTSAAVNVVLAVSLPVLLAQDAYRYMLFAAGRARAAAVNDLVWLLSEVVLITVLLVTDRATPAAVAAAFGSGGAAAALCGWRQTRVTPAPRSAWAWVARHRDLGVPFALELVAVTGMIQIAMLGVAVSAGLVALGALRAAMLLFGPLTVLFMGLFAVGVPEAVRLRQRPGPAMRRFIVGLGVAMPLAALLWALAVLLLPDSVGTGVLRSNWEPGRRLVPAMAVLVAGHSCTYAAVIGLRALGAARQSLVARLWAAPGFVIGGMAGASVAGARGAAAGLAAAAWVDAVLAWTAFGRAVARLAAPSAPGETARGAPDARAGEALGDLPEASPTGTM